MLVALDAALELKVVVVYGVEVDSRVLTIEVVTSGVEVTST